MSRTTARTLGVLLALLVLSPAMGGAGQLEISGWVGPSLPFYSQSFQFFFGERELEWKIDRFPISPELGELLRRQLDPIRFTPGFFQATAGLSVRF